MLKDTTVIRLRQPDAIDDPLTELAREGARRMLAQALIAEADAFVALRKDLKLPDGRDRVVRHGHGPHRAIQTGVGPVEVRRAKVRDRGEVGAEEKIRFTSSILPKWAWRTKTLDALLPVLYLRGVSNWRLPGGARCPVGKGRAQLVASRDLAADRGMAGGLRCLAETRSRGAAIRVRVGRWGLLAGPDGTDRRMHARADRCDPRRQEGTGRLPDRGAGEHTKLARTPHRHQATWARDRARSGGRQACPRESQGARSASGRPSRRSFPAPDTSGVGFIRPPTC